MIVTKWDITNKCNLRCRHCSVAEMYYQDIEISPLPLEHKILLIDKLASGGVTHLSLLGGEPLLLANELPDLLQTTLKHGIKVSIVTNGTLLNKDISRMFLELNLDKIIFSIESPDEYSHDQIRGKGTFKKAVKNLEDFLSLMKPENITKVGINSVLCKLNRGTYPLMIPFCKTYGINFWTALTLNYIGNVMTDINSLVLSDADHTSVALEIGKQIGLSNIQSDELEINFTLVYPLVWEYLCTKYKINLPQPVICCNASKSLVYLSPDGNVSLCDRVVTSGYLGKYLEKEQIHSDDLLSNNFNTIWNSQQYNEMYRFINNRGTYKSYEPCGRCKYFYNKTCNPCPLYALDNNHYEFTECMKAEMYLQHKKSKSALLCKEQRNPIIVDMDKNINYDMNNTYIQKTPDIRIANQTEEDWILFHPISNREININFIGYYIWHLIDGTQTINEIILSLLNILLQQDNGKENSLAISANIQNIKEFSNQIRNNSELFLTQLLALNFIYVTETPSFIKKNYNLQEVY